MNYSLITLFALLEAKKTDTPNQWWIKMVEVLALTPRAFGDFEKGLKEDGLFDNNLYKMYEKLKKAEIRGDDGVVYRRGGKKL